MIDPRIQALVKQACVATAVQGRPAFDGSSCLYTTDDGCHCAVGHALTPDMQDTVGRYQGSVGQLVLEYEDVGKHLGMTKCHDTAADSLWRRVQVAHDGAAGRRPKGVSWGRWFWSKARNACAEHGVDIGGFPRHLVGDAS